MAYEKRRRLKLRISKNLLTENARESAQRSSAKIDLSFNSRQQQLTCLVRKSGKIQNCYDFFSTPFHFTRFSKARQTLWAHLPSLFCQHFKITKWIIRCDSPKCKYICFEHLSYVTDLFEQETSPSRREKVQNVCQEAFQRPRQSRG